MRYGYLFDMPSAVLCALLLASAWWTQPNADEYWLITGVSGSRAYAHTYAAISAHLFSDLVRHKACVKVTIFRRGIIKVWKCYSR